MLQIAGPVTRVRLIGYAGRHSGTILCSRANNLKETHVTLDVSFFPVSSQCPSQVSLSQIWCVTHPRPFQGSGATTRPSSIRQISYNCLMQQRETLTSVPQGLPPSASSISGFVLLAASSLRTPRVFVSMQLK
ncbi:hypothetical protein CCHR01_04519 [Colletotrichum chrysophilum]|uniref:Uncharacterized protein n=1 Tax=Colletotrichum chrysophilum TaxID=1836956 RepID=A0AAD9AST7_9PEZI|nr:hypothetical protein CCHR01_04519 [Colletotrichum chrysophilum]